MAKKRESDRKKAIADADNLREKQKEMRDSIDYEYSIRSVQQQLDLEKQIADIKKAGFSPADQSMYINFAQTRFNAEKDLYQAKLAFEVRILHHLNAGLILYLITELLDHVSPVQIYI